MKSISENLRIILLTGGFLFMTIIVVNESKASKHPCVFMSVLGEPGTWLEGSCYGSGSSCAAFVCAD